MKLEIRSQLKDRLERIDWMTQCGEPVDFRLSIGVTYVDTWDKAARSCRGRAWEDTTLEARNVLAAQLSVGCHHEMNDWNPITRTAKEYLSFSVVPVLSRVRDRLALDDGLIVDIRWNLLAAIMEDVYRECQPPPPGFFLELLTVYERGHFPCGWEGGEWPIGRLIVF